MRTKRFLMAAALVAAAIGARAQITFERLYGGAGDDRAYSVVQLADNGYVMAGYTESFGPTRDGYVVRTDANGAVLWSNTYGTSTQNEEFRDIMLTADGQLLAVGSAVNATKCYAVKITLAGAVTWSHTYDISNVVTNLELAINVVQAGDGNYLIGGSVNSPVDSVRAAVLKIATATGNVIWFNDYNGKTNLGTGIVEMPDGSLMTSSGTTQATAGLYDFSMMHLTAGGAITTLDSSPQAKNYGGGLNDGSYDLIQTADGGFLMSGHSWSFGPLPPSPSPASDYLAAYIKTDVDGDTLWTRLMVMPGRKQRSFSVIEANDGHFVTAVFDAPTAADPSPSNFYVYQMEPTLGVLGWSRQFGSPTSDEVCYSLIQTSDDGYAVIGYSDNMGGSGGYDFYLVKTDTNCMVPGNCLPQPEAYSTHVAPIIHQRPITVHPKPLELAIATVATPQTIEDSIPLCLPVVSFYSSDSAFCPYTCISFHDMSTGSPTSWSWSFPGSTTPTSTDQHPGYICYETPGVYPVTLTVTNASGSATLTMTSFITVYTPINPGITTNDDTNICAGEEMILTSSFPTGNYWLPNGEFTQDITITSPGTYIVLAVDEHGCDASDTIEITSQNCCFAAGNSLFTQITSNITINTNTVWANKYYIAPGVIVTVDGVELDLTNVDIVFGQCAGIDFINGANLRATTSVFRPCNEYVSWRGFVFSGVSSGIVNTCTFKNAFIASDVDSDCPVRFTSNVFINCRVGILLRENYNESITGNSFTIDNTPITYLDGDCSEVGGFFYGILASNVIYGDVITQNDFNYSAASTSQDKQYIGIIDLRGSNGHISSNHFSNMHRSIDLVNSASFTIDNNTMEVTAANNNTLHQVRINGQPGRPVTSIDMSGNTISYDGVPTASFSSHSALYVRYASGCSFNNNIIDGFETAMQLLNVTNTNVAENAITDSRFYGIYLKDCDRTDVSCNSILMQPRSDFGWVAGIAYFQASSANAQMTLRSNCIWDTKVAIYLTGPNAFAPLPEITNNFLYNYSRFGVYSDHFTGTIGTAVNMNAAGKNSFVSNNNGLGATDIASTPGTIGSQGNFGILATSNVAPIAGTNAFSSIAACGSQVGPNTTQYGNLEECKKETKLFRLANVHNDGTAALVPDYETLLLGAGESYFVAVLATMDVLAVNTTTTAQDQLLATVNAQHRLNASQDALFYHTYLGATHQYAQAIANLPALNVLGAEASDFIEVERIRLQLQQAGLPVTAMSATDRGTLQTITDGAGRYAPQAVDLLQVAAAGYDYYFEPVLPMVINETLPVEQLTVANTLDVYPNPASDVITIHYITLVPDACELRVTDIAGRLVMIRPLGFDKNEEQVDVSGLTNGMYFFTIYENNVPVANSRLVKE